MTTTPPRATWREWLGLAVLTLPLLMTATDVSVLFLALPSMAADLAPGSTQLLWILHAGEFLAAGVVLTMGRLGDRIGRRRLLVTGSAVYGLASLTAAYSTSPEMLLIARTVLGLAAATLGPTIMGLLRTMFRDPKEFSVAIAVTMSAFSAGMALGPPLGGVLLEYFWWGSVFLMNIPAAVLLLLTAPLLPRGENEGVGRVDLVSVLLSMAGILAVVFGLQEIADKAGSSDASLWPYAGSVLAGLVLVVVFVRRQSRIAEPLVDLRLFAVPAFTFSLLTVMLMMLVLSGADMLFAQYLQAVLGLSPWHAGLLLIAPAAASVVGGMLPPVLDRWMRPSYAMAGGLFVAAAGAVAMALLVGHAGPYVLIAAATVVALGMGPLFTLSANLMFGAVPERQAGSAAAVNDVGGGLGSALSLAFLGSLSTVVYRMGLDRDAPDEAPEQAVAAAGESIGGATAVAEGLPDAVGRGLLEAAQSAFASGVQIGYAFGGGALVLVAALVLWGLHDARTDTMHTGDDLADPAGPADSADPAGPEDPEGSSDPKDLEGQTDPAGPSDTPEEMVPAER
ncbi:DHA2 family multidrug resistance protein-like MFS transporter [Murinocardiopsis flavida]|uniref:DHA2 family multidrug resistance protein-like MFS transporter n=1 Tax=Murinocardiopsis flavida TaxID=645275 RepID=A0A2P8DS74_9ACTN|nr:MFS transporter [Murinocardiopsis flavida]PSL00061.1 DHA2 family multidrug resistance protein-like MFS transporter [Murinocardiopsis flavida]